MTITQNNLLSSLDYDPETGEFRWRWRDDVPAKVNGRRAGKIAGYKMPNGYLQIKLGQIKDYGHRLAFLYMTGEMPPEDVDHIDGDRTNNAWRNLRSATRTENRWNTGAYKINTSGYKGAFYHSGARRWVAQINANGKKHYLGLFDTPEAAHAAYCKAAAELHGSFFRAA